MLYDNAQLARVYLHAWQLTGNDFFRTITEEILNYVVREMSDPAGGFYSTQDADSEGEEGKFFIWTPDEIREVLGDDGDDVASAFMAAYGVTHHGNFDGKNILEFVGDMDQRPTLAKARRRLFEAREQRVHPGRDEKVLTSWNGLMLAAFSEGARALDRNDYAMVAERNAGLVLGHLRWDLDSGSRRWPMPSRIHGRSPSSVIPTLPTRRLCCALFAMATGPSRWWPWERKTHNLLPFHSFRIEVGWMGKQQPMCAATSPARRRRRDWKDCGHNWNSTGVFRQVAFEAECDLHL
jgi:hypothetical protein